MLVKAQAQKYFVALLALTLTCYPISGIKAEETNTNTEGTDPCEVTTAEGTERSPDCDRATPEKRNPTQRIQPNFSEEERRGFQQRGFSNFLTDALNGNSDPLGGGTIGGAVEGDGGLSPISPEERGILPNSDPTDVIIPRGVERK